MLSPRKAFWSFLLLLIPEGLAGQAVQAFRSIGREQDEANADAIAVSVGELTASLGMLRALRTLIVIANRPELAPFVGIVDGLESLAATAIDARDRPLEFVRRLETFNRATSRNESTMNSANFASLAESIQDDRARAAIDAAIALTSKPDFSIQVASPAVFQYVPDVVFTAGLGATGKVDDKVTFPISISTNLLGELGHAVFDAFGADGFAKYLKDNVAAGVDLHAGKTGKPSSELTLGLGQASLGALTFWPVIGIEQTDSADTRVPGALLLRRPGQATFATPIFATSFIATSLDQFLNRVKCGKLTPVFTAGVRFPFFYPGNTFDALTALFNERVAKYDREGDIQFVVSVDVPLVRINSKASQGCSK